MRLKDLRAVARQVGAITTTRDDPEFDERVLADILRRRAGRSDRIQFEPIRNKDGAGTLAATSDAQLLVRKEDDPAVRRLLTEVHGLDARTELSGRVIAYTGGRDPAALCRLAASLRRQGVPISANYVTPMGGYMKSVASPEMTEGRVPAFPEVESAQSPVRIAVIDTGVFGHDREDGWLADLDTGSNREVLDDSPQDGFLDFAAGHGSFCAGIVQQIVPEADIQVTKTLDSDGFADELAVATEMVAAVRAGLANGQHVIVNLSLGTETADDEHPVALGAALEIIDEEARQSDHEVLVVAAAGNYGHNRPCYPAAFPNVTAVAALTQGLQPAAWSSRGSWVDVCTIGEGVRSTFVPGTESPIIDADLEQFPQNAWALWSGTSFAAPQVAAAITKIAIDDGVAPSEAKRRLLEGAGEVPLYGKRVEVLPRI
ncbi:MAG TPA: S8 family serine peptidase [Jiangellaceae bacterium]